MKYFYALVRKDPDSAYGVEFPDLPGCFSAADEADDIVAMATEALELWFEDAENVEPRPLSDIMAAEREALAEGAFIVAVPRIRTMGKLVRVNLSLDRGTLEAIDTAATSRHLTRSAFLAEAARNEIEGRH